MSKIWKRINKINGKQDSYGAPTPKIKCTIELDIVKVANTLANNIAKISS